MNKYIDRDKLIRSIEFDALCQVYYSKRDAIDCIKAEPTADVVEVRYGKWEISSDGYYPYCDNCKTEPKNGVLSKFCPECGAKMDGKRSAK